MFSFLSVLCIVAEQSRLFGTGASLEASSGQKEWSAIRVLTSVALSEEITHEAVSKREMLTFWRLIMAAHTCPDRDVFTQAESYLQHLDRTISYERPVQGRLLPFIQVYLSAGLLQISYVLIYGTRPLRYNFIGFFSRLICSQSFSKYKPTYRYYCFNKCKQVLKTIYRKQTENV